MAQHRVDDMTLEELNRLIEQDVSIHNNAHQLSTRRAAARS